MTKQFTQLFLCSFHLFFGQGICLKMLLEPILAVLCAFLKHSMVEMNAKLEINHHLAASLHDFECSHFYLGE
jgi:hypothetical protein